MTSQSRSRIRVCSAGEGVAEPPEGGDYGGVAEDEQRVGAAQGGFVGRGRHRRQYMRPHGGCVGCADLWLPPSGGTAAPVWLPPSGGTAALVWLPPSGGTAAV